MKKIILIFSLLASVSCSTNESANTPKLIIGQEYQGGLIFYIDETGQHGLIVSNAVITASWGCEKIYVSGALGVEVGRGNQNTTDIVLGCSESSIAAKLCENLVNYGYSDWYLPSRGELSQLHFQKQKLTSISLPAENFWSSSQYSSGSAWYQHFGGNAGKVSPAVGDKSRVYRVCPIRAF
jgi:hypothetical protein